MAMSISFTQTRKKDGIGNPQNVYTIKVVTGPNTHLTKEIVEGAFFQLLAVEEDRKMQEGDVMFTLPSDRR